jgi:hypothetical protein
MGNVLIHGHDGAGTPSEAYVIRNHALVSEQPVAAVRKLGDYTTQQTAATLWDPAAGKSFVITDIVISTATAGKVTLLDDSTVIREYNLAANGGVVENMRTHEKSTAADNILKITTSAAMEVFVVVKGYEV